MRILTHKCSTAAAFGLSLSRGFGAELDVRDFGSRLVVSHDMPVRAPLLSAFLEVYAASDSRLPLALNIKACGLQAPLLTLLKKFRVRDYFVFDLAVPDIQGYLLRGMPVFTRQSEYEQKPPYYELARGVWLDELSSPWITPAVIRGHLAKGKKVCVVSPELHKRNFRKAWAGLLQAQKAPGAGSLFLCTDHPAEADRYFNGRD